jgi:hypothetical protein
MTKPISFLIDIAFFGTVLVLLVVTSLKVRRAKKSQNRLVQSLVNEGCMDWFRVKVSRPSFFERRIKLVGAESSAVLAHTADQVRVIAELGNGELLDRTFPKSDLHLAWLGNPGLGSANMHWISIGQDENRLMITADTGFNAVQSREATADICRKICPAFQLPVIAKSDFALEKNRASLAAIIVFAVLAAFALIDGVVVNDNELIRIGRIGYLAPVLFLVAVPAYFLLVRGKVPSRESLALSLMLVLSLFLAAVPAVKRVDQWLSASGPRTYAYTMTAAPHFSPVESGPPPLVFRGTRDYWEQFDEGSEHQFELIHGPLGLWQLDHTKLDRKFSAFYEEQGKHR